ncbi:MAG: hypothetical protein IKZ39_01220 [Lachnospiraceae bacterium]|nr:hypothetical protein [Lachnospiraceae bacterium]
MKKVTRIFLIMVLVLMAAGCINGGAVQNVSDDTESAQASSEIVLGGDEDNSQEETLSETSNEEVEESANTIDVNTEYEDFETVETSEGSEDVDVDLTAISGILVYSEVYNMMSTPENYMGKKIKMEGIYAIYFDDTYSTRYDACIVQDATACCATGIEFELSDELKFPDDYPEEGKIITVEGTFDTYDEGSYTYCILRNASLLKAEE